MVETLRYSQKVGVLSQMYISSRAMTLSLTQPLREMSTRNIF